MLPSEEVGGGEVGTAASPRVLTAAQASELIARCMAVREANEDCTAEVHGWRIVFKLQPRKPPAKAFGDITVFSPDNERYPTVAAVRRALGVVADQSDAADLVAADAAAPVAPVAGGRKKAKREAPPPVGDADGDVFIAERLLARRWVGNGKRRREQFLVRWQGMRVAHLVVARVRARAAHRVQGCDAGPHHGP